MEFESRLIPIMRETIDLVKMIFFKRLKDNLIAKNPDADSRYLSRLCGGVTNTLFGVENVDEPFASFVRENRDAIDAELVHLAVELKELCIPLTDALRMQVICDKMEGVDSSAVLVKAREIDVLLQERDLPLPHTFITLVRKLGSSYNLVKEMKEEKKTN